MKMARDVIDDRGEIIATRITVYNLLPYFLDPTVTEAYLCRLYDLTPEQVAAARAYVLNNPDTVLAQHLKIEARIAAGNPPQVIEQAKKTHDTFLKFKQWLDERQKVESKEQAEELMSENGPTGNGRFPSFREWLAEQESQAAQGS
jgi:uncharacterized protein (DUF433 family)